MAVVRIHNMMFYGFHGLYEYEREQGQKFFVDVSIEMDDEKAIQTDDVRDGVDTATVYDIVGEAVRHQRYTLLISLSAHIGDKLLAKYPHFKSVTATIRKPSVPIAGPIDYVEVETTRVRH